MGLEPRKEKRYTYADYLQWPDDTRYELIDGEAFRMAPTPLIEHQEIAGEVYCQLANQLDGQPCRPYIAPVDVRLPRADEADAAIDTVVQPDELLPSSMVTGASRTLPLSRQALRFLSCRCLIMCVDSPRQRGRWWAAG